MPVFLVETYLSVANARGRAARERRAQSAAATLTREGTPVRFEGAIHILEDEICFFTFDARSGRTAGEAARRAGLDPLRIVEAVLSVPAPGTDPHQSKENQ